MRTYVPEHAINQNFIRIGMDYATARLAVDELSNLWNPLA